MSNKAGDIIETIAFLNQRKANLSTFFQEIVDYVLPDRGNVTRFEMPGARRGVVRYDSTAVDGAEILAGNLAATLTPQGTMYQKFQMQDPELNELTTVRDWCDIASKTVMEERAKSNFYLRMDEVYLDLVGFCTAAIYSEMVDGKLSYQSWPVKDYTFTMGPDGRSRGVYRQWAMTAENVKKRFESHRGYVELGASVEQALREDARPTERLNMVRIAHAIVPRDDRDPYRKGAKNMPYASCYVNVDDRCVIAEGGFEEMPVNVVRWRLAADDDDGWGRGPGFTAMPDVRTLNNAVKMVHRAGAKDLDPPLVVEHKGVIGSVRTTPNGITYVRRDARFEQLLSGQRLDMAQFGVERTEQQIRRAFYSDHLRLPPPQGTPATATEMQLRWELMERLLGPTLGRLLVELLVPVAERDFMLLLRAGKMPKPPREVMENDLQIQFVGPLMLAQRKSEIAAIQQTYSVAGNIAAVTGDASIFDNLDGDEAVRIGAELNGAPTRIVRDKKDVAGIRDQKAQQAEQMQQRQDAALAADIASKAGGGARAA